MFDGSVGGMGCTKLWMVGLLLEGLEPGVGPLYLGVRLEIIPLMHLVGQPNVLLEVG